jgi:hypothetical protein
LSPVHAAAVIYAETLFATSRYYATPYYFQYNILTILLSLLRYCFPPLFLHIFAQSGWHRRAHRLNIFARFSRHAAISLLIYVFFFLSFHTLQVFIDEYIFATISYIRYLCPPFTTLSLATVHNIWSHTLPRQHTYTNILIIRVVFIIFYYTFTYTDDGTWLPQKTIASYTYIEKVVAWRPHEYSCWFYGEDSQPRAIYCLSLLV